MPAAENVRDRLLRRDDNYRSHIEGLPPVTELAAGASPDRPANPLWKGPLRVVRGFFSTFVYSHDPRDARAKMQRKILKYDFDGVCRWGGVLGIFTRASVLRVSTSLSTCLALTFLLCMVVAIVCSKWLHQEDESLLDADVESLQALQQRINIMVTFILGFFVQLNITRWWEQRQALKELHGSIADLILCMASVGFIEEHLRAVARLGCLSQALLFEEARGSFDEVDDDSLSSMPEQSRAGTRSNPYTGLMKLGLLTVDEAHHLAGLQQKSQVAWGWIGRYVIGVSEQGHALDHHHFGIKLLKRCCQGRAGVSNIKAFLGTQLPFTYVQLIAMLVQISHIIMACGCGYTIAAAWKAPVRRYCLIFSQVCQVVIVPLTFQSLLDVCVYINDPFGSDILDFSFLHYHVSLVNLCESLISPVPDALLQASSRSARPSTDSQGQAQPPASLAQQS